LAISSVFCLLIALSDPYFLGDIKRDYKRNFKLMVSQFFSDAKPAIEFFPLVDKAGLGYHYALISKIVYPWKGSDLPYIEKIFRYLEHPLNPDYLLTSLKSDDLQKLANQKQLALHKHEKWLLNHLKSKNSFKIF
jgi:hypothetical protein